MTQTRRYRPFTAAEDRAILASEEPIKSLAERFDRSTGAVSNRRRALQHGLLGRPRQTWDQEQDKAITAEDRPDDLTLANTLNRSLGSIQVRRSMLKKKSS